MLIIESVFQLPLAKNNMGHTNTGFYFLRFELAYKP